MEECLNSLWVRYCGLEEWIKKEWVSLGLLFFGAYNFLAWYVHTETYAVSIKFNVGSALLLGWYVHLPLGGLCWAWYVYRVFRKG